MWMSLSQSGVRVVASLQPWFSILRADKWQEHVRAGNCSVLETVEVRLTKKEELAAFGFLMKLKCLSYTIYIFNKAVF